MMKSIDLGELGVKADQAAVAATQARVVILIDQNRFGRPNWICTGSSRWIVDHRGRPNDASLVVMVWQRQRFDLSANKRFMPPMPRP